MNIWLKAAIIAGGIYAVGGIVSAGIVLYYGKGLKEAINAFVAWPLGLAFIIGMLGRK